MANRTTIVIAMHERYDERLASSHADRHTFSKKNDSICDRHAE
jgi:hypothetical protein